MMETARQKDSGNRFFRPLVFFASALTLLSFGLMIFGSCRENTSPKFNQYYTQGGKLYLKHCSNCHQSDGSGLRRVYPPLDTSDYMHQNFEKTICLIRNGVGGELIVNNTQFNQKMPGIPTLSDLEVAEIATYIYNSWSHDRGLIDVKEVSAILNKCGDSD